MSSIHVQLVVIQQIFDHVWPVQEVSQSPIVVTRTNTCYQMRAPENAQIWAYPK